MIRFLSINAQTRALWYLASHTRTHTQMAEVSKLLGIPSVRYEFPIKPSIVVADILGITDNQRLLLGEYCELAGGFKRLFQIQHFLIDSIHMHHGKKKRTKFKLADFDVTFHLDQAYRRILYGGRKKTVGLHGFPDDFTRELETALDIESKLDQDRPLKVDTLKVFGHLHESPFDVVQQSAKWDRNDWKLSGKISDALIKMRQYRTELCDFQQRVIDRVQRARGDQCAATLRRELERYTKQSEVFM